MKLMQRFESLFGTNKPIIAMVHLGALPGSPLYDAEFGVEGLVNNAEADLEALQAADVDAILFGNENDRPYELKVSSASSAAAAFIIGCLKKRIKIPFGVNMLWDPMSTIALGAATEAQFVREIFTGSYASDMGIWKPSASKAMRYRNHLGRSDMMMFYNISAEFAYSLDRRTIADRARSVEFSSIPDAVLVSGQITGEAAPLSELEAVKMALSSTPVMANTGVRHETLADVLKVANGCVVGTALKRDGDTWKAVDPERAKDFMKKAKSIRGSK